MRDHHIPTTAEPLPFTPPSLYSGYAEQTADGASGDALPEAVPVKTDSDPVFLVKPLTEAEFDRLGYELFRHNIVPPSNDTYRALMIDEIFNIYGDEKGEEHANLMDAYWQAEDVHRAQMEEWHEQDRQRMFDESQGAPAKKPLPLPVRMTTVRERNRALMLAEEIKNQSRKLRDLTVDMQSYEPKQRAGIARLVVLGWSNLAVEHKIVEGIIPEDVYEALRSEIGRTATRELEAFCASMGTLTGAERGNSALPPATEPSQEPSPQPTGELASTGGGSISEAATPLSTSTSTQAPESASDVITDASSTSTSPSTGEAMSTDAILAEHSPARPSD